MMILIQEVPKKKFLLHDGTHGTEYEAVAECIKHWERKKQEAEDQIEEFRRRLDLADGHP